jgi:hypothetical protein
MASKNQLGFLLIVTPLKFPGKCPIYHGGLLFSVVRIKDHKRAHRTIRGLRCVLTSVVITFYLQLYCMIKTITSYYLLEVTRVYGHPKQITA